MLDKIKAMPTRVILSILFIITILIALAFASPLGFILASITIGFTFLLCFAIYSIADYAADVWGMK